LEFRSHGALCIEPAAGEYRIGRPRVWVNQRGHHMFFTYGTLDGDYLPGYAHSPDGREWRRDDARIGLSPSPEGWDSKSVCYLAPIAVDDRVYVFYNGNDMGRAGFGCAEVNDPELFP
jgi:hypothetical protein